MNFSLCKKCFLIAIFIPIFLSGCVNPYVNFEYKDFNPSTRQFHYFENDGEAKVISSKPINFSKYNRLLVIAVNSEYAYDFGGGFSSKITGNFYSIRGFKNFINAENLSSYLISQGYSSESIPDVADFSDFKKIADQYGNFLVADVTVNINQNLLFVTSKLNIKIIDPETSKVYFEAESIWRSQSVAVDRGRVYPVLNAYSSWLKSNKGF